MSIIVFIFVSILVTMGIVLLSRGGKNGSGSRDIQRRCPACDHINVRKGEFCANCGGKLH